MMNDALHVGPQSMPPGTLVTVPSPAPASITETANVQRPNELEALGKDCIHSEYDPAGSPGGSSATIAVGAKLSTLSCIPPSSTTGVAPTPKLRPPMKSVVPAASASADVICG